MIDEECAALRKSPSGYHLVTPEDWWRVPLNDGRHVRSISALVERQFKGQDDLPQVKQRVRQSLLDEAERSIAAGGIELYLSQLVVGPVPVSASLMISIAPGAGHPWDRDSLVQLADHFASPPDAEAEVNSAEGDQRQVDQAEVIDLPGTGPAIRIRTTTPIPAAEESVAGYDTAGFDTFGVEWFVPIPSGSGELLVLTYSSPMVQLRPALNELFDTVTATLTWEWPTPDEPLDSPAEHSSTSTTKSGEAVP